MTSHTQIPHVKKGERLGYNQDRDALVVIEELKDTSFVLRLYPDGSVVHRVQDWTGAGSFTNEHKADSHGAKLGLRTIFHAFERHQRPIPPKFEKFRPTT